MAEIDRPIFIIGTGRSGTSIFHRLMCDHPQVAYLNVLFGLHPDRPWINRLILRGIDLPLLGRWARQRFRGWEVNGFWEKYFPGYRRPCRDLFASDVTPPIKERLRSAVAEVFVPRRRRLLDKITGWPRMGFLREVFPDARFVQVRRDGRAVVHSLMNTNWWDGWQGPTQWRWGALTAEQQAVWDRHGRSFFALGGLQWNILMAAMQRAVREVPAEQYLEISYEELCADSVGTVRRVVDHCGLDWTAAFEARVRSRPMRNTNDKWQRDLTPAQQAILNDVMQDQLRRYGYMS